MVANIINIFYYATFWLHFLLFEFCSKYSIVKTGKAGIVYRLSLFSDRANNVLRLIALFLFFRRRYRIRCGNSIWLVLS